MIHGHLRHADVYRPSSYWSEDEVLHVATAYSNPFRWATRRRLMNDFRRHMAASSNVVLYVGELSYGDRPFEVTGADDEFEPKHPTVGQYHDRYRNVNYNRSHGNNPPILFHENDVQLRTAHELWHKENILNAIIQRFPTDWKYGAWIDADFGMTRPDWALEAIHLLQHYDFVQLFSSYTDLSAQHRPLRLMPSFAWNYLHQSEFRESLAKKVRITEEDCYYGKMPPGGFPFGGIPGATGGAWAFRRSALNTVGCLLEICILGSADWHMAFGLVGAINVASEMKRCTQPYIRAILRWQDRASKLQKNIGCIDNHAIHHFHGSKKNRAYGDRWKILQVNNFDPDIDLHRDWQNIWQLSGNKPELRDEIRKYFLSRDEDNNSLAYGETTLL